jgi:hypothetical protein
MLDHKLPIADTRQLLYWLLSISASLAGFCVAGIGLLNVNPKAQSYSCPGDDILGLASVLFLICTYLAFWALRTGKESRMAFLAKIIDVFFLIALTLVVISGVGIAYTIF